MNAEFFFGRETFVESLVRVVNQQPLVAVIGSSGSGKSSVVLAGLIPKLREEGSWLIESFRPNKQPFYELAAALISQLEPELGKTDKNIKAKELAESIRKHGFTADVSAILKDKPGKSLLLVIDQFEELYTGCAATEQQQFVDTLLAVINSASRTVRLVLTLRADFYSYVVNYPPFGEALNKYPAQNLSMMKTEEMQAAIELPAEKMGVKLEEGLTQRILDDVNQEPGNLPLLEFALTQLWDKQSRGLLTHQAYSDIGGVAKALSNHAEAVYGKLSEPEQKQAQRIFLQLVRPGEGTEDTRRVANRGEVGNWDLVTHLADARLVVTGRNEATGEETVEVVHEALIREWGLLRGWIDENRKKLIQKQEIEDAAKKWRDRGNAKDYLLGGQVLTEAMVFQKQEAGNMRLSVLAQEFIQISQKANRQAQIIAGLAIVIPLLTIAIAAVISWRLTTQQRIQRLVQDALEGTGSPELVKILPDLLQQADQYKNKGDVDRSLASYRVILTATDNLRKAITESPVQFKPEDARQVQETSAKAESSLVAIIQKYRLPRLERELTSGSFGEIKATPQYTDFELQYTEGALRTTYALLMRDFGVSADLNKNGLLEKEEAERIPCAILQDIERLWRQSTQNRCGWFGSQSYYEETACRELDGKTLLPTIFADPITIPLNRLKSCHAAPEPSRQKQ